MREPWKPDLEEARIKEKIQAQDKKLGRIKSCREITREVSAEKT